MTPSERRFRVKQPSRIVSSIVTVVVHEETFPRSSLAVKITVVVPSGNMPEASAPPSLKSLVIVEPLPHVSNPVAGSRTTGARP